MYNVILRRVYETIVAVEKQLVLKILSLCYPICKAQMPYYFVICGLSGSFLFFHIVSQTERLSEKAVQHKTCDFIFSSTFV
jgi:TRAP-type uncharacterized transport system fused permease subunit